MAPPNSGMLGLVPSNRTGPGLVRDMRLFRHASAELALRCCDAMWAQASSLEGLLGQCARVLSAMGQWGHWSRCRLPRDSRDSLVYLKNGYIAFRTSHHIT